ncbi:hypothetical protein SEA_CLUBPENGUIN_52 [Streptomyces phage ClubPenguin]|nr:hypothetical protein SEA_CLUBPENGUIN_52 [Streptomyces phage ClubPenguin]
MDESHSIETVEVLDKEFRVIFIGREGRAVEWVCENALGPDMVWLRGYNDLMSIDEWLQEWDSLQEE